MTQRATLKSLYTNKGEEINMTNLKEFTPIITHEDFLTLIHWRDEVEEHNKEKAIAIQKCIDKMIKKLYKRIKEQKKYLSNEDGLTIVSPISNELGCLNTKCLINGLVLHKKF